MSSQATKVYEILKTKGFSEKEAEEFIEFVKDVPELKIREIIQRLEKVDADLSLLKGEVSKIKEELTELRIDFAKSQEQSKNFATKDDLSDVKVDLIKWMIGTGIAIIAILITALKLLD